MILLKKILIKMKFLKCLRNLKYNGGEGGIRTHGGIAPSSVFKTDAFDHSATSPGRFNLLELKYITIFNSETQIFDIV